MHPRVKFLFTGVKDIVNFDFINKPSPVSVEASLTELTMLGAIHQAEPTGSGYELTPLGRKMAQFPLEPRLSRCILAAVKLNCVEDVLKIVSILSVDTIFHKSNGTSASGKQDLAEAIKQKFVSADGDHFTLLNVYKAFVANKNNKAG